MTTYQHTQIGSAILYPLIIAIVIGVVISLLSPILRLGLVIALPLALVAWMFAKLTVTIDDTYLRASFGPGFV